MDITLEDLVSISFAAVDTAIKKFNASKNQSFYAYWSRIATNAMKSYVKKVLLASHTNGNVSLDEQNDTGGSLHDIVSSNDIEEPISLYSSLMRIINDERNHFTEMEKKIISLFLDGFEIKEIALKIKINKAKAYREYHKALNKLRHSLIDKK